MKYGGWNFDVSNHASNQPGDIVLDQTWLRKRFAEFEAQRAISFFDYGEHWSGSSPRVVVVQVQSTGSFVDHDLEEVGRVITRTLSELDAVVAIALKATDHGVIEVATWARSQDLDELDCIIDYQVESGDKLPGVDLHFSVYGPGELTYEEASRSGYVTVYLNDQDAD